MKSTHHNYFPAWNVRRDIVQHVNDFLVVLLQFYVDFLASILRNYCLSAILDLLGSHHSSDSLYRGHLAHLVDLARSLIPKGGDPSHRTRARR